MAMAIDPGAMRRQRLLETRKLAVTVEKQKQQEYRDAVVLSVEKEVAMRREKWEEDKAHQLLALQRLYAQSLAMIGSGQKAAAQELLSDSVGAQEHKQAWEQLSRTALVRGEEARQQVLHAQSQYSPTPLAVDTALYRHEVHRQAAMAERWHSRRVSMAAAETVAPRPVPVVQAQAEGAGVDTARSRTMQHRSRSSGDRSASRERGSRASVYYGPHAGDPPVRVRDERGRRGVFKQPRVPAVGTLDAGGVSSVRVPVVVAPGHACDPSVSPDGPSAHERAEEEARQVQEAREEAGRALLAAQAEEERRVKIAEDAAAGIRALEALTAQLEAEGGMGGAGVEGHTMDLTQDIGEEGEGEDISLPDVTGAWLSWQQAGRAAASSQGMAPGVGAQAGAEDEEATPAPAAVPQAARSAESVSALGSVGMRTVGGSWAVLGNAQAHAQGMAVAVGQGGMLARTGEYSLAYALQEEEGAQGGQEADAEQSDPYYASYYGLGLVVPVGVGGHEGSTGKRIHAGMVPLQEQHLPEGDD